MISMMVIAKKTGMNINASHMKGIAMNRKNRKLFSGIIVAVLVLAMLVPMLVSLL